MRITFSVLSDKQQRKALMRYWLTDPVLGALNYLGFYLLRCLPAQTVSAAGEWLAPRVISLRFPKVAQRANSNLERLRPDLSTEQRQQVLTALWQNIGKVYAEFSSINRIWTQGRVSVVNENIMLQALSQACPIVFVFPHLGNWEFLCKYLADKNIPVLIMFKPGRNRFEHHMAVRGRKDFGLDIQPEGAKTILADAPAMRKACAHLAQGKHLMVAMDGLQHNQAMVPKFDRNLPPTSTNIDFAVRLAKRYNAIVIPFWCERLPQDQFVIHVTESLTVANDVEAKNASEALDKRLESWILAKPEQWFYLHNLRF